MAKSSVFNYLLKVRSEDGVVHLTLIDPDPLKQTPEVAGQMAKYAYEAVSYTHLTLPTTERV